MRDAVVPGRAGRLPTRPAGPQRHCTWAGGSTGTPYLPPEWGLAHRLPREPGGRGRSLGWGSEQAGSPATQPPSRGPGVRPACGATDRPSSSELAPPGQLGQRCQGLGRRPASYPARWFMGHMHSPGPGVAPASGFTPRCAPGHLPPAQSPRPDSRAGSPRVPQGPGVAGAPTPAGTCANRNDTLYPAPAVITEKLLPAGAAAL